MSRITFTAEQLAASALAAPHELLQKFWDEEFAQLKRDIAARNEAASFAPPSASDNPAPPPTKDDSQ